jgi:hypothetical protein
MPSVGKTFKLTAGWLAISYGPALVYTLIVQLAFGHSLKSLAARSLPNLPAWVEPFAMFGFFYITVACFFSFKILASEQSQDLVEAINPVEK